MSVVAARMDSSRHAIRRQSFCSRVCLARCAQCIRWVLPVVPHGCPLCKRKVDDLNFIGPGARSCGTDYGVRWRWDDDTGCRGASLARASLARPRRSVLRSFVSAICKLPAGSTATPEKRLGAGMLVVKLNSSDPAGRTRRTPHRSHRTCTHRPPSPPTRHNSRGDVSCTCRTSSREPSYPRTVRNPFILDIE